MAVDKKFVNVLLLGLAFMLIFTAFQTIGNIQVSGYYINNCFWSFQIK